MSSEQRNQDQALADRLVSYSDAVAALAFVGVSGLGLSVADPDIRESIVRAADWVAGTNLFTGVVLSAVLFLIRRWELDLRAAIPPSAKASEYGRKLHWVRLGVVWFSTVQAVVLMLLIR